MGRSSRQRNSKEIAGLNNSVDQVDQIDIYRAFCPATAETDSERKERSDFWLPEVGDWRKLVKRYKLPVINK